MPTQEQPKRELEDVCSRAEVLKTTLAKGHSELSQVEGTIELSKLMRFSCLKF